MFLEPFWTFCEFFFLFVMLLLFFANILRTIACWIELFANWIHPPLKKKHHLQLVRGRKNDIWLTPVEVATKHIASIPNDSAVWVDPFRNTGNYYNNFPESVEKEWCEILEGRDALNHNYSNKVVVSNPPYSIINKLLDKMCDDGVSVISFLLLVIHITMPRMNKMKNRGYIVTRMEFFNVNQFMHTAVAITWERKKNTDPPTIEFNYMKGGFQ